MCRPSERPFFVPGREHQVALYNAQSCSSGNAKARKSCQKKKKESFKRQLYAGIDVECVFFMRVATIPNFFRCQCFLCVFSINTYVLFSSIFLFFLSRGFRKAYAQQVPSRSDPHAFPPALSHVQILKPRTYNRAGLNAQPLRKKALGLLLHIRTQLFSLLFFIV